MSLIVYVQLLSIVHPKTAILIHRSTTSSASVLLYPWNINRPFDVVKTRQQMAGGQTAINNYSVVEGSEYCGRQSCVETSKGRPPPTSTTRNVGTFGYMQQIVQTEGISGLWKGNVTRMVKIAPA